MNEFAFAGASILMEDQEYLATVADVADATKGANTQIGYLMVFNAGDIDMASWMPCNEAYIITCNTSISTTIYKRTTCVTCVFSIKGIVDYSFVVMSIGGTSRCSWGNLVHELFDKAVGVGCKLGRAFRI